MNNKIESIFKKDKVGNGKRKQSVARVFLVPGTGNIVINNIPGEKYLQYNLSYLNNIWAPLQILNLEICICMQMFINICSTEAI